MRRGKGLSLRLAEIWCGTKKGCLKNPPQGERLQRVEQVPLRQHHALGNTCIVVMGGESGHPM